MDQDQEMGKRIGIFGGTFDPVHTGHLIAAESACEALGLDRIYFIPAYDPPHKAGRVRNVEDRLQMLTLALADNPRFALDRREIEAKEVSYTLHTVQAILQEQPGSTIYMVIGEDSLVYLKTWYHWEELLDLVQLVVVRRPMAEDHFAQARAELEAAGHAVHVIDKARIDLSSEEIRQLVAEGKSIRYLVPDPVAAYIQDHGLYQQGEGEA